MVTTASFASPRQRLARSPDVSLGGLTHRPARRIGRHYGRSGESVEAKPETELKEAYTYRGHSIALSLSPIEHGRVRWTYFIDEDYCIQDTSASLPIEAVRINALALAHRSIDALDSIVSFGKRPAAVVAAGHGAASSADRTSIVPSMRALHSDRAKRSFSR